MTNRDELQTGLRSIGQAIVLSDGIIGHNEIRLHKAGHRKVVFKQISHETQQVRALAELSCPRGQLRIFAAVHFQDIELIKD